MNILSPAGYTLFPPSCPQAPHKSKPNGSHAYMNGCAQRRLYSFGFAFLLFTSIPLGALEFASSPGPYPHGLTTDGTNLWHTDYDAMMVYKLNSSGEVTQSFSFPYGNPRGLAWENGVLFVASGTRVYRLNAQTGGYLSDFASPDNTSPSHQGLALGGGRLWIASVGSSDDRIYSVNPTTGQTLSSFIAPGTNPRGLVYYDASLWNLDSTDDRLYRLSTNGSVEASYPIPLGDPRGLTFYNGRFVLTDMVVDSLVSFDITNTFSSVYIAHSRFAPPNSSLWLPYISSHALDQTNSTIRRILFFQHGVDDNATQYFARAHYAARLAGRLDETLIVSFQLLDNGKLTSTPPTNMIYWVADRFWGAPSAGPADVYPRAQQFSAFQLLDCFLSQLTTNVSLLPQLEEIVVSGHSGGGQFVNRFAAVSPFEHTLLPSARRISMEYVVMNPSSYVYFNSNRYNPATLNLATGNIEFIAPSSPSAGYDDYGYGLQNLYQYPAAVGIANIAAQYPIRKVVYLAGGADTGTADLDVSAAAMTQGTNRYERCLIYYAHLKDEFGSTDLSRHRLAVIPGIGHDSFGMITSTDGLRYHFQGQIRVTNFFTMGTSAGLSWSGGDGFADVQVSTNLQSWHAVATKVTSPFVDPNGGTATNDQRFYRIKESAGP